MHREFRKLAASFRAAFTGLVRATKSERNFRIHLCAIVYVLFFAWLGGVNRYYYPALIICFGMVTMAELFNTAIELVCNVISDRFDMMLKAIKDIAAGAVLICAFFAAMVGIHIFANPSVLNKILFSLADNLWLSLLLLISIAPTLLFIFKKHRL